MNFGEYTLSTPFDAQIVTAVWAIVAIGMMEVVPEIVKADCWAAVNGVPKKSASMPIAVIGHEP